MRGNQVTLSRSLLSGLTPSTSKKPFSILPASEGRSQCSFKFVMTFKSKRIKCSNVAAWREVQII